MTSMKDADGFVRCPYCGSEMQKGNLTAGGRRIFWSKRQMRLTSFAKMGDIPLAPDYWHGAVENAYVCLDCKRVIVDIQTNVKKVRIEPNGNMVDADKPQEEAAEEAPKTEE